MEWFSFLVYGLGVHILFAFGGLTILAILFRFLIDKVFPK